MSTVQGHFHSAFAGKSCWVSGHSGFKGGWLTCWLLELGAQVHGFSLATESNTRYPTISEHLPLTPPNGNSTWSDLRDAAAVAESIWQAQPDFVFHLGAQAIVRDSFYDPCGTYLTNVMGTVHVLEALRKLDHPCSAIFVTTDKCYENREWVHSYREVDPLGGYDPYSSSKAAAELAVASWRQSFFADHPVRIATVRSGNVIGGGDWAAHRIVPDCIRATFSQEPIRVRNPRATRPWQHVLEPLSGYLWLAAALKQPDVVQRPVEELTSAFNFGPLLTSNRSVADLVRQITQQYGEGEWIDSSDPHDGLHEAGRLNLAIDKAFHLLKWQPVWDLETGVAETVAWYREVAANPDAVLHATRQQISRFCTAAQELDAIWTRPC